MVTHNKLNIYCYYVQFKTMLNPYVNRQITQCTTKPNDDDDDDDGAAKGKSVRRVYSKEKYKNETDGHMNANKFADKSKKKPCHIPYNNNNTWMKIIEINIGRCDVFCCIGNDSKKLMFNADKNRKKNFLNKFNIGIDLEIGYLLFISTAIEIHFDFMFDTDTRALFRGSTKNGIIPQSKSKWVYVCDLVRFSRCFLLSIHLIHSQDTFYMKWINKHALQHNNSNELKFMFYGICVCCFSLFSVCFDCAS